MHEPHCDASFGFIDPVAQYDHDHGRANTEGFVYRGSEVPDPDGRYVFGASSTPTRGISSAAARPGSRS
jgi:hypothetical protein